MQSAQRRASDTSYWTRIPLPSGRNLSSTTPIFRSTLPMFQPRSGLRWFSVLQPVMSVPGPGSFVSGILPVVLQICGSDNSLIDYAFRLRKCDTCMVSIVCGLWLFIFKCFILRTGLSIFRRRRHVERNPTYNWRIPWPARWCLECCHQNLSLQYEYLFL